MERVSLMSKNIFGELAYHKTKGLGVIISSEQNPHTGTIMFAYEQSVSNDGSAYGAVSFDDLLIVKDNDVNKNTQGNIFAQRVYTKGEIPKPAIIISHKMEYPDIVRIVYLDVFSNTPFIVYSAYSELNVI